MINNINWERVAWWANQPHYERDANGLFDVEQRAIRLKKMHDYFGTTPKVGFGHWCESRELLQREMLN